MLINNFPGFPIGSGLDPCPLRLTFRAHPPPNVSNVFLLFFPFMRVSNALPVSLPLQIFLFLQGRTQSSFVSMNTVPIVIALFWTPVKCTSCAIHLPFTCWNNFSNVTALSLQADKLLEYVLSHIFLCPLWTAALSEYVDYLFAIQIYPVSWLSFPLLMAEKLIF